MRPPHLESGRLPTHQLPRQVFDQLCSGAITGDFIAAVGASQYSRRKLLLRALADFCAADRDIAGPLTDVDLLWDILATAEERDPAVVQEILTYPTVGVWATRTLRRLHGRESDSIPVWSEFGYLHSLVAAAAVRTGVTCVIRLPVMGGVVTLPTVGHTHPPTSFPIGFVDLHNTPAGATLKTARGKTLVDLTDLDFLPARRHDTTVRGLHLRVEINDSDPYREFSAPIPPRRLDAVRLAEWRKMLDEAFDILTLWHPEYAQELAAGLRVVTPLAPDGAIRGASSSVAFGCVAVSEKNSATELAETLVHEFQHSKLNGLLTLFDVGRQENMYAPWRDDPRPLSGLLHGIFAFISVIEFWRVQRDLVSHQESKTAHFTFALRRHQVQEAVRSVRHHPALTPVGHELVEAAHNRLVAVEREPVDPELAETITKITDDHRGCWRIRHGHPDPLAVERLATAWLTGGPAPATAPGRIEPNPHQAGRSARRYLLELKAVDPTAFAESTVYSADTAYVSGDYRAATNAYVTQLRDSPDDRDSWIGLGLALQSQERPAAAGILTDPETSFAVYNRILAMTDSAPDPLRLANWLGGAFAGVE